MAVPVNITHNKPTTHTATMHSATCRCGGAGGLGVAQRHPRNHPSSPKINQCSSSSSIHAAGGGSIDRLQLTPQQAPPTALDKLLTNYWEARGVFNPQQRQELVEIAKSLSAVYATDSFDEVVNVGGGGGAVDINQLQEGAPLPGIPTTWALSQSVPEIRAVSQRLLELHALLGGGGDIDVIWMVTREPTLLTASKHQLMSRLMAMKLATVGAGVDVVKVVERQPSLLLVEEGSPLSDWNQLDPEELQQQIQAWECGVASDSDPEWRARADQLRAYHRQHGDTSVGHREGDDPDLARWATAQRRAMLSGLLSEDKLELLQELGFESDEDEAEWLRWFMDLARFKEQHGHASPMSMSAGADLYLCNWCSVQRVAKRCRVLSNKRVELLESIEFDWTGADPLS